VFYNTGVPLMKLERYGAAYVAFGQALAAMAKSAPWAQVPSSHLQNNLAWTAFKSGQLDVAEAHMALALQADPDNLLARGTAGSIAFACGRTEEAMKHFASAMAGGSDPDPGPEVTTRSDYRELAMRFGTPVELTDEEAEALGPQGYIDEVDDDEVDEDEDE
jgi:tetratricopeptide (TPR) repeat protein